MSNFNERSISAANDFLSNDIVCADERYSIPRDDAGLPLDIDYWICTCGHENQGTDRCEVCDEFLHERDWYW